MVASDCIKLLKEDIMIHSPVEYLSITVDHNNNFYVDGNITTIDQLGIDGWEMICVLPNIQYREEDILKEDKSLYFSSSYPSGKREMIYTIEMIPYHIAIFKRQKWIEL
jgi:hypothetical protein